MKEKENSVLDQFIQIMQSLFDSLGEVFPECKKTRKVSERFTVSVLPSESMQKTVIDAWHKEMQPLYDACKRLEYEEIARREISFFQAIDLATKWSDDGFGEESRSNFWSYINELNMHAQVYHLTPDHYATDEQRVLHQEILQHVPTGILSKFENLAESLFAGDGQAEPNLQNLNIMALMTKMQGVASSSSEAELAEFARNAPKILEMFTEKNVETLGISRSSPLFGSLSTIRKTWKEEEE